MYQNEELYSTWRTSYLVVTLIGYLLPFVVWLIWHDRLDTKVFLIILCVGFGLGIYAREKYIGLGLAKILMEYVDWERIEKDLVRTSAPKE